MYILVYQIVPGVVLGFLLPTDGSGWFLYSLSIAVLYSIVTMAVELVRGKAQARSWQARLADELEAEEDSEIVAQAVLHASIANQFIYKFHLVGFVVGCLVIAIPVTIVSAITFAFR